MQLFVTGTDLDVLEALRALTHGAFRISANAAITACVNAECWEQVRRSVFISPQLYIFSCAACEACAATSAAAVSVALLFSERKSTESAMT